MEKCDLVDLATRVAAAAGPDPRLDAEIWAVAEPDGREIEFDEAGNGFRRVIVKGEDTGFRDPAPAFTDSVDRALMLHQKLNEEAGWLIWLLQGWSRADKEQTKPSWQASTMIRDGHAGGHPQNDAWDATTPAQAVVAAALMAAATVPGW